VPKIIQMGQCFTELLKKNNSGMFLWTKVHCFSIVQLPAANQEYLTAVFKH